MSEVNTGSPETPKGRGAIQNDGVEQLKFESLWLEVANVRLNTAAEAPDAIDVQLRGDRHNRWWPAPSMKEAFKSLVEALQNKRPVHALIRAEGGILVVSEVAILFAEPQR